jgi:hypothetical protein
VAGGVFVAACSGDDTAPVKSKTGGGPGAGGDDASVGGDGGAGGGPVGGDGGAPVGPAGGNAGSPVGGEYIPAKCVKVPTNGFMTDFSKLCPQDGSIGDQACFGAWLSMFGGTWAAYPKAGSVPDNTGSDAEPDSGCTSFSTGGLTSSVATGAWETKGTVGTYSGMGIWYAPCVNATGFAGIQFKVSGDAGPTGKLQVQGSQLTNWANGAQGGTCTATCMYSTATVPVTTTPTVVQVPWSAFTGGTPNDSIDDPAHLMQFQWGFDWSCLDNNAPYDVDVVIDDLAFYKAD